MEKTYKVIQKTHWKIKATNKNEAIKKVQDNKGKYLYTNYSVSGGK